MNIKAHYLLSHDWVPNNPRLPVLIYRGALAAVSDRAAEFETRFSRHGWTGIWRNGVYDYQHYHTGAHEVLGIASGTACLLIGGPEGLKVDVEAGDCLLLPAGTGHCRLTKEDTFLVVGAYPPGQHADIKTDRPSDRDIERIASLFLPETDPLEGLDGPLRHRWLEG